MKTNKSLNLNINKDDHGLNDYIYTWFSNGVRPSKTNIHGYFKPDTFINYFQNLENITYEEICNFTDVVPSEDVSIINQKSFIKLDEEIYLTFTHLDKEHDDGIISDISIFFSISKEEIVNKIISELSELISNLEEKDEDDEGSNNMFILNLGQNGFELEYFDSNKDFENIEYFFEESILKKTKKLIKTIKKEKKGLTVITGERGCGKTNLMHYMSSKIDKNVVFVPCNLLESSLGNPEFRKFLKINRNSVLVIDDSELFFNQIYSKSTFYTTNLLQLIDGFISDTLNINFIISFNCNLTEVDKTLLDSNNLLDIIEVKKLSLSKIEDLCEHLGQKSKFDKPTKLVDVIKNNTNTVEKNQVGFK